MSNVQRRTVLSGLGAAAWSASMAAPTAARRDLYACEGCEAVGERSRAGMPATVDLAGPKEPGAHFVLTGVVLSAVERKPTADVVVYAHHTNAKGLYADGAGETELSRRHGRLRGWAKTGADGVYTFRTIKPAPYPDMTMPAHIHLMIGEPGRPAYYIDDVVFEGEFGVTDRYRGGQQLRGGSGISRLAKTAGGAWLARRDIILERHPT